MSSDSELVKKELFDAIVGNDGQVLAALKRQRPPNGPERNDQRPGSRHGGVGVRFERRKLFLPHVMVAADAMTAGVKVVEKGIPKGKDARRHPLS